MPLMLRILKEIAASTEQSLIGTLEHTIARYKINIHPETLAALKYRGYVEEYGVYYRVTDKGIDYLVRYHKYELSNREN